MQDQYLRPGSIHIFDPYYLIYYVQSEEYNFKYVTLKPENRFCWEEYSMWTW